MAHHQIPPEKVGVALGQASSPEICGFFNISARVKASDFKFGARFGFAKTHYQMIPRGKVGVALG